MKTVILTLVPSIKLTFTVVIRHVDGNEHVDSI